MNKRLYYKHFFWVVLMMSIFTNVSFGKEEEIDTVVYPVRRGLLPDVTREQFYQLNMRIGTVEGESHTKHSRNPANTYKVFFTKNPARKLKRSCAQLRDFYDWEQRISLLHQQITAITNFPAISMGETSYFLILGAVGTEAEDGGTVVLQPSIKVEDNSRVILLDDQIEEVPVHLEIANPHETFHKLDIRVGVVESAQDKRVSFGEDLGSITYRGDYPFEDGMYVLKLFNLTPEPEDDDAQRDNFLGIREGEKQIPLTLDNKSIRRFIGRNIRPGLYIK